MNDIKGSFESWAKSKNLQLTFGVDCKNYYYPQTKAAWGAYNAAHDAQQATIDRLMLEYCPGEMTQEQMDEWASHQKAYKVDLE